MNALEIREQLSAIALICGAGYEARLTISSDLAFSHNRSPAVVEIGVDLDGGWGPKRKIRAECASITAALLRAREKALGERKYQQDRAIKDRARILVREAIDQGFSIDFAAAAIADEPLRLAVLAQAHAIIAALTPKESDHG